jgi:dipeptidyl aminopeptidase/acylaminoacyl peptidase
MSDGETEDGDATAERDPLLRASDYRDLVQVGEPRVHPDGDRVAFVRTVPNGDDSYEATVYVVDTDATAPDDEPRQFTVAEGQDSSPRYSPSGDRLAFVSTRGADDDRPQLWVLPTTGGEARRVTDVAGGVASIEWAPDGERIVFTQQSTAADREAERDLSVPAEFEPEEPDPRVVDRTVWRGFQRYFDGRRSHVYVLDLAADADDSEDLTRLTDGDHDYSGPTWGDDGTVYYTRRPESAPDPDDTDEFEIVAHDLSSEATTVVTTTSGWGAALAATGDGRIAYPHTPAERTSMQQTDLKVYDRDDDTEHTPTAELDRTLGYDAAPEWGPDERYLYFSTPDEGAVLYRRAPWDGDGSEVATVAGEGKHVDGGSPGPATGPVVAYTASESDHRGDVFAVVDGEERRLTRVNEALLGAVELADPEPLSVAGPAGEVQGWLLLPPAPAREDGRQRFPLVAEIHGGPHAMWTTSGTMFHEFQTLAARGYAVFWSNPRGSSGYGESFMQAIERDWGAVTLADVEAGVDRVVEREEIDETQVFVTGGSFGGYMTAWAVGHTDRFEAAVSQRGVYDLAGFYGSTDEAYKLVEGDFDAVPWGEPAFLHEHSPTAHVDEVDTPTLLVHGDRDYRTPVNTAERFYRGLRKNGVDTRLVRYPREGHELSRSGEPAHVVDRIERIARWFDGYSEYHDADRALDRDRDDGLSAGDDESDDGTDRETDGA